MRLMCMRIYTVDTMNVNLMMLCENNKTRHYWYKNLHRTTRFIGRTKQWRVATSTFRFVENDALHQGSDKMKVGVIFVSISTPTAARGVFLLKCAHLTDVFLRIGKTRTLCVSVNTVFLMCRRKHRN